MTANKIDVIDMACEGIPQEVLGFNYLNRRVEISTPYYESNCCYFFPALTPFEGCDFLLLEEANSFLEAILNSEPPLPPPSQGTYLPEVRTELKVCETNTTNSSVDEPTEVELKELPPHLEKSSVKVLKAHMRALPLGKFSDFRVSTRILYPQDLYGRRLAPAVKHQRRVPGCPIIGYQKKEEWTVTMDVFMDDLGLGQFFQQTALRLDHMLQRCEDTNLSLNWEKSHFMVKEGIVLGHKISKKGIEVDKAKIDVIAKLPHPTSQKDLGARTSQPISVQIGNTRLKNVNDPKEIKTKVSPLETLNMVTFSGDSRTRGFADFAIISRGDVCTAMKLLRFSQLATMDPPGDKFMDCPDCEDSQFCHSSSASFGNPIS
ncbi:hypothetical protein Tco_0568888 [Tanacetum coccineum]